MRRDELMSHTSQIKNIVSTFGKYKIDLWLGVCGIFGRNRAGFVKSSVEQLRLLSGFSKGQTHRNENEAMLIHYLFWKQSQKKKKKNTGRNYRK